MNETNLLERITVQPNQCHGRPCIRGLRIRVSDVLGMLASGMEVNEILADYPYMERDDIMAALQYASRQAERPVLLTA